MAFINANHVKESSTTTGTGALTLSGAQLMSVAFSTKMSVADTCHYCARNMNLGEWEVGLGTYSGVNTLTRTTIFASSNAGAAVDFSAGTKDVFITTAAEWFIDPNVTGTLTLTGGKIKPASDGLTAIQITKADGTTPITNVDTTNRIFEITQNDTIVAHLSGTALAVIGANNAVVRLGISSYGTAGMGAFAVRQARNTAASPQAVQLNDTLMSLEGWGYGATGWSVAPRVMFRGYASETWTDAAQGSYASIWTTPTGSLVPAERIRVLQSGYVGVGTITPVNRLDIEGSCAIGATYSGTSAAPANGLIVEGKALFGTTTDDGANQLQVTGGIKASGNVTSSLSLKSVKDSSDSAPDHITLSGLTSTNKQLIIGYNTTSNYASIQSIEQTVGVTPLVLQGLTGNVIIGSFTDDTANALQVTGNITVSGVYKVDNVQVVSNRVIDARCDDAVNSGDATTDGVIDALRDALITHGLIAAA